MITPRPTKYRAWTGREMVVVQSLCFNDKGCIWYGPGTHMGWAFVWPNAEWTKDDPKPSDNDLKPVMQWTGERDSLGQEIWEGDIMASRGNYITDEHNEDGSYLDLRNVVVWNRISTRFALKPVKQYLKENKTPVDPKFDYPWICAITVFKEVIGNVYQTPDLLKS